MPDRFNITSLNRGEVQYSCSLCILTCNTCHCIQTVPCTTVTIFRVQNIGWNVFVRIFFLLRNAINCLYWKSKEE
ncbi:hypothetical protein FQN60_017982 [Etheostoma spectabile]|uniref:Uncharacterized protein n=1 Tax=Etheostoma spectabile TaxID=54343 RepID=A0A5J5DGR1_9PERO|nr:hypothetical protein FQN60_017982 [Etheostoma spectabile]